MRLTEKFATRVFDLLDTLVERILPHRLTHLVPCLLLLPALLLVLLLTCGLVLIVGQSLHAFDPDTQMLKTVFTASNYLALWKLARFRLLIGRTAAAGTITALCCVLIALPYAYVVVRTRSAGLKKLLILVAMIPFLLGAVVRGYAWLLILGREGVFNRLLEIFGVEPLPLIYNMTAVMIGLVQLYLPFAILLIIPSLTAIKEELEEAGQSLGGRWPRVARTVILPLALPGIAGAFVTILTLSFSEMVIPLMLGGGRTDFVANAIYSSYVNSGDTGMGAALSTVTAASATLVAAFFFATRRWVARRVPA
jgi:putative spermidine/putrescine transport system permease protein